MSKKDVIKGFIDIENQYLNMLSEIKDYEEAYKDKFITQEQMEHAQELLNLSKMNYDRWGYIVYLLNKPNKKSKQPSYSKQNKNLEKHFKDTNSTKEDMIDEADDCLRKFKEYIESEVGENK